MRDEHRDDEQDGEPVDDDVPVYEPMYPEHEALCSHPACSGDAPPGERICSDCVTIMLADRPDECTHCGEDI